MNLLERRLRWTARLARDESGQDLIEYALLSALVGIASILAWTAIESALGTRYQSYVTDSNLLWEPPNPGGT